MEEAGLKAHLAGSGRQYLGRGGSGRGGCDIHHEDKGESAITRWEGA